jgi:hypothetical protein
MCAPGLIQYRKSVAEEGGMNKGHTWTQSGLQVGNSRKSLVIWTTTIFPQAVEPGKKAGKDGSHRQNAKGKDCVF